MKPVLHAWWPLLLSVAAWAPGPAMGTGPVLPVQAVSGAQRAVPAPLGPATFWPSERQWQALREQVPLQPELEAFVQSQYRLVAQHWEHAPPAPTRLAPEPAPAPPGLAFLQALGFLFQLTGDPAYAQRASQVLQAWVARVPPSGEALEASRLEPALWAYRLLRPALAVPERTRIDAWWQAWAQALWAARDLSQRSAQDRHNSHRLKTVGLIGDALGDGAWVERVRLGLQQQLMDNLLPSGETLDHQAQPQLAVQVDDLRALLTLALALRESGPDLYRWTSPNGASMAHSVAWTLARAPQAGRGPGSASAARASEGAPPAPAAWQAWLALVQAWQPGMVPPEAFNDAAARESSVALRRWLNSVAGQRIQP
ncbi:alginate lyase family protein [Curvibacter sp. RS43]|uniref:alginate lyase family protein n=1 Tax=Curvibacter microcysteis TaxID=3026419 RepID=UPI00235F1291|nr:alginate lyase family protein [Curvibacter sp. RS43]MDD0811108.1 alginate lyase family protein [Curvibacter sp. RS43]